MTGTVFCHLLRFFPNTSNFLLFIVYGPFPNNCEEYTHLTSLNEAYPGDTVTVKNLFIVGINFCFTVSINNGATTLAIFEEFLSGEFVY